MILKINLKSIIYFTAFLLLAFPACYIKAGSILLRTTVITTIIFLVIYFCLAPIYFIKNIFNCIKLKISQNILLLFCWIILSGIIACCLDLCPPLKFIIALLFRFIPLVLIPYFLGYWIAKHSQINEIIKFYYILFILVLIVGLLDFLFSFFDFPILSYTIVNHRTLLEGEVRKAVYFGGITRVQSVFDEPSYMGWFLATHLPIMYNMVNYKYKIFKRPLISILAKKIMPIGAWVLIILGMSPMFIFIFFAETIIYKIAKNSKNIKKIFFNMLAIIFAITTAFLVFKYADFSNSFLGRIQYVINNLGDIYQLIVLEPSLGTRITCYYASFRVFLENPIWGVGLGGIVPHVYDKFTTIGLPLTFEIQRWLSNPDSQNCNYAILWTTLAENGFIGIILLYKIFIDSIKKAQKELKFVYSHEYIFLEGLVFSLITMFILSIYDSGLTLGYIWFLIGILTVIIRAEISKTKSINNVRTQINNQGGR